MEAVWAEEVLRDRPLSPEATYKLTLLATGSEAAAHDAKVDVIMHERRERFLHGPAGA